MKAFPGPSRFLPAILIGSALLRVVLALQGGQFFFGDESRFFRGAILYQELITGSFPRAFELLQAPHHGGFTLVVLALSPLLHGWAILSGHGDWSQPVNLLAGLHSAAALLGFFSTLNIWLVYRLALVTGADASEAGWAALLAASSNTLFYYSRHLLPYDCALTATLTGLLFTVTGTDWRRVLAGGCGAGMCFTIYNGYWFIVPVTGIALLLTQPGWSARGRAALVWTSGCLAAVALVGLPGVIGAGRAYWGHLTVFAGTAKQGLFAEGWSLPWEYFRHSEGWLGALLLACLAVAVLRAGAGRRCPPRLWLWLGLAGFAYGLLVLVSSGLERQVIYARTTRPLVVFFVLVGGWALEQLAGASRQRRLAAAGAVILLGALNLLPNFTLRFPREVELSVARSAGVTKRAYSFGGVYDPPVPLNVTRPDLVLVNPQYLHPLRDYVGYPAGETLAAYPHPLAYAPYQYEGHTPRERRLLRTHAPAIRLIRLANPGSVPDRPAPDRQLGPVDEADGYDHHRVL